MTSSNSSVDIDRKVLFTKGLDGFLEYIIGDKKGVFYCKEMADWLRFCYDDFISTDFDNPRAKNHIKMMQVYRGAGKTSVATVIGLAWVILLRPNITIGVYTKNIEFAIDILKRIGHLIESEKFKALFCSLYQENFTTLLTLDNKDAKSLDLPIFEKDEKVPTITAMSLGTNDTGKHFDLIVCDDIVSEKDSVSDVDRANSIRRFTDTFTNVLKHSGTMVLIGTPHHKYDLYGYIQEKFSNPDDSVCFSIRKYPLFSLSKDRGARGEQIKQKAIKTGGMRNCNSHYMLNMEDDNINEPFSKIREGETTINRQRNNILKIIAAIDPAYKGKDSTAVVIIFKTRGADDIYFLGKMWLSSSIIVAPEIVDFLVSYKVSDIFIEENRDMGFLADRIKNLYQEKGEFTSIHSVTNTATKKTRIYGNIEPKLDNLFLLNKESDIEFVHQLKSWNEQSTLDDAPDALALGLEYGFPVKKYQERNYVIPSEETFYF